MSLTNIAAKTESERPERRDDGDGRARPRGRPRAGDGFDGCEEFGPACGRRGHPRQSRRYPRRQCTGRGGRQTARRQRRVSRPADAGRQARRGDGRRGSRTSPTCPIPWAACSTEWTRPNGLKISRVRVPLGVIGIIYESRPNVTADAGGLCLKAGNAAILRGGTESALSSRAINAALVDGLKSARAAGSRDPDGADPGPGGRRRSCCA